MSWLLPACFVRRKIQKVEPAFWWSGMKNPELQILLYGTDIATDSISITASDIRVKEIVKLQNPKLLTALSGSVGNCSAAIRHSTDKERGTNNHPLSDKKGARRTRLPGKVSMLQTFLYLIMPDRFANGDPKNDVVPNARVESGSYGYVCPSRR